MNSVLHDTSTPALISAIESNLIELTSLCGNLPHTEVYNGADIFWSITDIPFGLFNSILRARLTRDNADEIIEAAINRARSRNVPLLWWTCPTNKPSNLGEYLIKHDFKYIGDSPGMAVDLQNLNINYQPQPELIVKTVNDPYSLKIWSRILTAGFGLPEFVGNAFLDIFSSAGLGPDSLARHYIGWLKGEPVAVSSLFLGGGVAGIYNLASIPNVRRQGTGSAMIMKPLREARAMGYRTGILQASEMGLSVYRRLGFKECCMLNHYFWSDETMQTIEPGTDNLLPGQ